MVQLLLVATNITRDALVVQLLFVATDTTRDACIHYSFLDSPVRLTGCQNPDNYQLTFSRYSCCL